MKKYTIAAVLLMGLACAKGDSGTPIGFPQHVIAEDALSPELKKLPKLDLSKEAAESVRLDWEVAPESIKVALQNNDVASLRSFLGSQDLHVRWYAAHALGRVQEGQLRARSALNEFLSSRVQAKADGSAVRTGVMGRFLEDAVEWEASRSLGLLPDYSLHWWAMVFMLVVAVIGLTKRLCVKRNA